ncbi:MAG: hypothetical protein Kow0098_10520 [Ignavibacteriaceae bacterium]
MKKLLLLILLLPLISSRAQQEIKTITGRITFISSQNVYVKFDSTAGITQGDTLYLKKNPEVPAVVVKFISSGSVAGEKLDEKLNLNIGDELITEVIYIIPKENQQQDTSVTDTIVIAVQDSLPDDDKVIIEEKKIPETKIGGKFTINSYSNFSNNFNYYDYQRWRYSFKINFEKPGGLPVSIQNYTNFSYRADEWNEVSSNLGKSLRVYDLSVKVQPSETFRIFFGRYINSRISNLSSVDGLQIEKGFDQWNLGLVAGSRPNFLDMGYNLKLFEYGLYINRFDSIGNSFLSSTVSFFEQTNDFTTDRRFLYFQHYNNLIENTNLFLSTEIDLYKTEYGKGKNDFSLTSFFISARVTPSRLISFNTSYDARKNVIYYETFKNFIDSVVERETRQGFRASANIRPFQYTSIGMNFGYRFQNGDLKPSKNYGGFINYSRIPFIQASFTLNFTRLLSSYLDGLLWGVRMYRTMEFAPVDLTLGYRKSDYTYLSTQSKIKQHIVSADITTRISKAIFLLAGYEGIFEDAITSGRVLVTLSYRY